MLTSDLHMHKYICACHPSHICSNTHTHIRRGNGREEKQTNKGFRDAIGIWKKNNTKCHVILSLDFSASNTVINRLLFF